MTTSDINKSILNKLIPPCSFQGGKQRLAPEIVDLIFSTSVMNDHTKFYDLCCGSGTITLELINRGISPKNITMVDASSWGVFWQAIGNDDYNIEKFKQYILEIPQDRSKIQKHLKDLSEGDPCIDEEYIYPILQAGSFGGKQIWHEGGKWKNASFRSFWQPTETSKRRSPVNPMMPMPNEVYNRVKNIANKCKGITCFYMDIYDFLEQCQNLNANNSVFYIDPPYKDSTGYGFDFEWEDFVSELLSETMSPIYVSERESHSELSFMLNFKSKKGGISGNKGHTSNEWLNVFK